MICNYHQYHNNFIFKTTSTNRRFLAVMPRHTESFQDMHFN